MSEYLFFEFHVLLNIVLTGGIVFLILHRNAGEKRKRKLYKKICLFFRQLIPMNWQGINVVAAFSVVSPPFQIVQNKAQLTDLLGYSEKEIRVLTFTELLDSSQENLKKARHCLAVLENGGDIKDCYLLFRHKSGRQIPLHVSAAPDISHKNGQLSYHFAVFKFNRFQQLNNELTLKSQIVDNISEGIFLIGYDDGIIKYVNSEFEKLFGYAPGELIGKSAKRINYALGEKYHEILQSLSKTTESWCGEVYNQKKDGTGFWCNTNLSLFEHSQYKTVLVGVQSDITKQKRSQDILQDNEARFRAIFEQAVVGVAQLRTQTGEYIKINQQYCSMLGYSLEEMQHTTFMQVTHPDDVQENLDLLVPLREGKIREFSIEKRYIHKNGSIVWGNLTVSPMWKTGEKAEYHIAIVEDITRRKLAEQALKESQMQWQALVKTSPDHILMVDANLYIQFANVPFPGLTLEEMSGQSVYKFYSPEKKQQEIQEVLNHVMRTGVQQTFESVYESPKGDRIYYESRVIARKTDEDEKNIGLTISSRNITERIRARAELIQSNIQLKAEIQKKEKVESEQRKLFEMPSALIMIAHTDTTIIQVSAGWRNVLGYSREELEGRSFLDFIHPDDGRATNRENQKIVEGQTILNFENRYRHKDGTWLTFNWSASTDKKTGIIFGIAQNITDRIVAEEKIQTSLKEKEMLLQEIHHRVKNNMTVISSLLSLQARKVEHSHIKEILTESQNRVQAMSLIHESLYQSANLASIEMENYLKRLVHTLFNTYGYSANQIECIIEAGATRLSIKKATPLGLLVNELITNILKYAFPDKRQGCIIISLTQCEKEKCYRLMVSDNGIGLKKNIDWKNTDSLGLKLVRMIVENQLAGTITVKNHTGTKFIIEFPEEAFE